MHIRSLLLAATVAGACAAPAVAQDTPQQLNTPPAAPDTAVVQTVPAPAPRQQPQPRYRIGLTNGAVYAADEVEMRQPAIGRSYLLLNGQQRFELDQIKFFDDETGHYIRTNLPGSRRLATMRREKTGRISTYSITSQQYMPGGYGGPFGYGGYGYGRMGYPYGGLGGYPYGGYRTVKTEYFSKDGGPVQDISYRNLSVALSDNPGSAEVMRDVSRLRRFSTAGYVVGGGLLAAGMLSTLNGNSRGLPLVLVSVPVLLIPTFLSSSQAKKMQQAVQLYNYGSAASR